jgi:hypothetical protein
MTDKIENCLSAPALEWGKLQRVRKNFGKYVVISCSVFKKRQSFQKFARIFEVQLWNVTENRFPPW